MGLRQSKFDGSMAVLCKFKELLAKFYALAKEQDICLKEPAPHIFEKFESHPAELREQIIQKLATYVSIYAEASDEKVDFREEGKVLWYALKGFGLRPTSDLLNYISSEDIVEIYNAQGLQIYRNFNFFEISSYSPGDYLVYSWSELYDRNAFITEQIMKIAGDLFSGKYKNVIPSSVPEHLLEEKFSERCFVLQMKQKYFAPLYDNQGNVAAAVATCRVSQVDSKRKIAESPNTEVFN